ncbi:MAG TPA: hypothetical protein VHY08_20780 [Bacillota bacterium]|nr:hypothetical protein [Bacillota bacterium]
MKIPANIIRLRNNYYLNNNTLGNFRLGLPGNEIIIATPTKFKIQPLEPKQQRTVSGKLTMDTTTPKYTFTLWYKMLTSSQMQTILTEIERGQPLSFQYLNQTKTVLCQSFPHELLSATPELWENITLILVEE